MSMADTIAVMNKGRVEQLGGPAELYETPATVFVANFLGQSNLLAGTVAGRSGGDLLLDVSGHRVVMPAARSASNADRLFVGVRPEKLHLNPLAAPVPESHNQLDVQVIDSSFIGVSTQYQVRTRWGQTLSVFTQNLSSEVGPRPGDMVRVHWDPKSAFGLDGSEDMHAGEILDPELSGAK
jgi:spermidine/putrescine transport system ATP-binding protein